MEHSRRATFHLSVLFCVGVLVAAVEPPPTDLYGDPLPPGAVARLGTIRFRSGRSPSGLAFLPDSKTFVTVSREDVGIQFWEAETGRSLREISVEPMVVEGFAISRDGKQFAVTGFWYPEDRSQGTKGEVRVLDAAIHRDIVSCDVAVITCLNDTPGKREAGELILYPGRRFEPLSAIRANPERGALKLRLTPGQTLVMFGGVIPHAVLPTALGQSRIVSVLCYRAS